VLQTAITRASIHAPLAAFSLGAKTRPRRTVDTRVSVAQGSTIFEEGAAAEYFYKLESGCVRLVKIMGGGQRQICDFHMPSDLLGLETAALHSFSAEAISDCVLLRYRKRDLITLIESDPHFAHELQTLTARGLNGAYAHLVRLCHRSARDRLAWFLLGMLDRTRSCDGWIELPMGRVDIADYLGLAHETVSRAFTQLKKVGAIVEPTLNRIHVVNRDFLEDQLEAA